jgi:hypothetical protein
MSGKNGTLPSPEGLARAYKMLLKKESIIKPASVTKRIEILQAQQRSNYKNEYDRISGLIEGYADRFARPGGGHDKQKLLNRQNDLKKLFRQSHNHDDHPIRGKEAENARRPFSSVASSGFLAGI